MLDVCWCNQSMLRGDSCKDDNSAGFPTPRVVDMLPQGENATFDLATSGILKLKRGSTRNQTALLIALFIVNINRWQNQQTWLRTLLFRFICRRVALYDVYFWERICPLEVAPMEHGDVETGSWGSSNWCEAGTMDRCWWWSLESTYGGGPQNAFQHSIY